MKVAVAGGNVAVGLLVAEAVRLGTAVGEGGSGVEVAEGAAVGVRMGAVVTAASCAGCDRPDQKKRPEMINMPKTAVPNMILGHFSVVVPGEGIGCLLICERYCSWVSY